MRAEWLVYAACQTPQPLRLLPLFLIQPCERWRVEILCENASGVDCWFGPAHWSCLIPRVQQQQQQCLLLVILLSKDHSATRNPIFTASTSSWLMSAKVSGRVKSHRHSIAKFFSLQMWCIHLPEAVHPCVCHPLKLLVSVNLCDTGSTFWHSQVQTKGQRSRLTKHQRWTSFLCVLLHSSHEKSFLSMLRPYTVKINPPKSF